MSNFSQNLFQSFASKRNLLLVLFGLSAAYRFFAVYPPPLTYDPAVVALQACHVLEGATPVFWPGQAFMGMGGAYLEALFFKLFGMSYLTLSVFAWTLCMLWMGSVLFMTFRFFGVNAALLTGFLVLIPTDTLMYWASLARPDYALCFLISPWLLWITFDAVRRFRQGSLALGFPGFGLGLLSGFSFWNNMVSSPLIGACFLVLAFHLRSRFWKRAFLPYTLGFVLGVSPVIHYHLTHEFVLTSQANFPGFSSIVFALKAFFTNALPFYWGLSFSESPFKNGLSLLFLIYVGGLFFCFLIQTLRSARAGKETLAEQLTLGFVSFHMLLACVSNFGARFAHASPILYVTLLYTVSFTIPAVALSRFSKKWALLGFLPFLFYLGNNLANTRHHPERFIHALDQKGWSASHPFPDAEQPLALLCREHNLRRGYTESFRLPFWNLDLFGLASVSHAYDEAYFEEALQTDASRDIFWVESQYNPGRAFKTLGCLFKEEALPDKTRVFFDFKKPWRQESLIEGYGVELSTNQVHASFLGDDRVDRFWTPSQSEPGPIEMKILFHQTESVNKIAWIPQSAGSVPERFKIFALQGENDWKEIMSVKEGQAFFWSVFHPFFKKVKPRMEIQLPKETQTRALKIVIEPQKKKIALRLMYLYRGGAELPAEACEKDLEALIGTVNSLPQDSVLLADHWFENYFALQGRPVDFVSNESVNDNGLRNPNLNHCPGLDKMKPHAAVSPKAHSRGVEKRLRSLGLPFEKKEFLLFDLFLLPPSKKSGNLYWNGVDLMEGIAEESVQDPSLRSMYPEAEEQDVLFEKAFALFSTRITLNEDGRNITLQMDLSAIDPLPNPHFVYVHFCDENGKLLFQGDFKMKHPLGDTSQWAPGKRILLEYNISVPPQVSGRLFPRFGIWNPETQRQLKIQNQESRFVSLSPLEVAKSIL